MSEYHFVGVDIAKAKFDATCLVNTRTYKGVFDNNLAGFKRFVSWLKKNTQVAWVCLEATGCYSEGLAEFLVNQTIKVSVVNPMQIKNYAKAILARNKNDILDSKIIALFAKSAQPRCFIPRSQGQKDLREMVQLTETLNSQRQQLLNQLESLQSHEAKKEVKSIILSLDKRLIRLGERIKKIVKENEDLDDKKQRLISIVGIGEKTAHQLLAYLPDISLFSHAKQLAAFAGVTPRQRASGTVTGKSRLSKFGNPRLRKALYMPALVAKNKNPYLKSFCQRLESNGLKPKAIVCAVMRKLLHIIYGMFKSGQNFDPALVCK